MTNETVTRWHLKYVRPAIAELERDYTPAELDQLIANHIDPHPDGAGVSEAATRDRNVAVWALIGYIEVSKGDLDDVASGFCISTDAVRAAVAFYARYRQAIQARLLINNPELVEVSD
jgi:uncharacterized protein (DUF433 family)